LNVVDFITRNSCSCVILCFTLYLSRSKNKNHVRMNNNHHNNNNNNIIII